MRQVPKTQKLKIADLTENPRNYRGHPDDQLGRIGRSLEMHGQYKNVVVQAVSDDGQRHNVIIAGHGVVAAAQAIGEMTIEAKVLEIGDAEALKLLVDDNELSRRAEDDGEGLAELLADLHGTEFAPESFNDGEIESLLKGLTEPRMTDDAGLEPSLDERWMVVVECEQEAQQLELLERFTAEGLICRALIG